MPEAPTTSDYRLAPALRARIFGGTIVAVAAVVFVATAIVVLFVAPVWILSIAVVLCLISIFAGGVALNRSWVVRLDSTGYQVRLIRGAGVPRGRWSEVEDVVSTQVAGNECLVLRRREGAQTTIPLAAVAEHQQLIVEVRRHLDGRSGQPRPKRVN